MYIMGIDPGATGAIALMNNSNMPGVAVEVWDMPRDLQEWKNLKNTIYFVDGRVDHIFLEYVHSMPGQGVRSVFSFGMNYGMCQMWATMAFPATPITMVSPQKWKKILDPDCKSLGKEASLIYARRRWPNIQLDLKRHHGRADALCLCEYGRRFLI